MVGGRGGGHCEPNIKEHIPGLGLTAPWIFKSMWKWHLGTWELVTPQLMSQLHGGDIGSWGSMDPSMWGGFKEYTSSHWPAGLLFKILWALRPDNERGYPLYGSWLPGTSKNQAGAVSLSFPAQDFKLPALQLWLGCQGAGNQRLPAKYKVLCARSPSAFPHLSGCL